MGFFSGLKKMFDTGGIAIALDAPKSFSWEGDGIPVTVTVTGGEEPRTVTALEFELEDEPDGGGSPGLSSRNRDRDRTTISSRNRFRMLFTHEGPFELGAKEVKTFELTVPIQTQHNPGSGVADAIVGAVLGGTLNFGAAWYKLSVGAPVEGAKAIRTTSRRIKASGQMRVTGGTGR
ncbi:MAG: hypothetical protein KF680_10815 [Cryobacterium sp.]|nr:hypothetical protein [Cryobacterium sp.]